MPPPPQAATRSFTTALPVFPSALESFGVPGFLGFSPLALFVDTSRPPDAALLRRPTRVLSVSRTAASSFVGFVTSYGVPPGAGCDSAVRGEAASPTVVPPISTVAVEGWGAPEAAALAGWRAAEAATGLGASTPSATAAAGGDVAEAAARWTALGSADAIAG